MRVLNVSSLNSTRPKGARFGFTLIELLVAMVIFGVVAGAFPEGLVDETGEGRRDESLKADAVLIDRLLIRIYHINDCVHLDA